MLRRSVCILACLLFLAGAMFACGADDTAQPAGNIPPTEPSEGSALRSYIVQLTEFRMKTGPNSKLTARDLAQILEEQKENSDFQVIETVRLSTRATHESLVQFGKSVTVTSGTVHSQFGRARNTQQRQIGTIVRVLARDERGKVLIKLSYEAARHHEDAADDSPPDVTTTKFETTLLLKVGVPAIVGSTTSDPSSCLLINVTE